MSVEHTARQRRVTFIIGAALLLAAISMPAQQMVTETRDPAQTQDEDFAKLVKEWTTQPYFISPLVDHLPKVHGYPVAEGRARLSRRRAAEADLLRRHPEVLPRARGGDARACKIETIGKSDEDRELVVVWVSSDENIKNLAEEPRQPREDRRPARADRGADHAAHRDDAGRTIT